MMRGITRLCITRGVAEKCWSCRKAKGRLTGTDCLEMASTRYTDPTGVEHALTGLIVRHHIHDKLMEALQQHQSIGNANAMASNIAAARQMMKGAAGAQATAAAADAQAILRSQQQELKPKPEPVTAPPHLRLLGAPLPGLPDPSLPTAQFKQELHVTEEFAGSAENHSRPRKSLFAGLAPSPQQLPPQQAQHTQPQQAQHMQPQQAAPQLLVSLHGANAAAAAGPSVLSGANVSVNVSVTVGAAQMKEGQKEGSDCEEEEEDGVGAGGLAAAYRLSDAERQRIQQHRQQRKSQG